MLGIDVDRLLQDQVVLLRIRHLLDHTVGALEDLLQLLVATRVEVFLELATLALEIAVQLDQLLLAVGALAFRQGGRLALQLLGLALEGRAQRLEISPTAP